MQTNPQCIVRTLINCCLHSEATISFNMAQKNRFCDANATLDAGVCFATMTTESRRRREQVRAWKGQRGNFRHYFKKKTNRTELLSAWSWLTLYLCQDAKCTPAHRECTSFGTSLACLFSVFRCLSFWRGDTTSSLADVGRITFQRRRV